MLCIPLQFTSIPAGSVAANNISELNPGVLNAPITQDMYGYIVFLVLLNNFHLDNFTQVEIKLLHASFSGKPRTSSQNLLLHRIICKN